MKFRIGFVLAAIVVYSHSSQAQFDPGAAAVAAALAAQQAAMQQQIAMQAQQAAAAAKAAADAKATADALAARGGGMNSPPTFVGGPGGSSGSSNGGSSGGSGSSPKLFGTLDLPKVAKDNGRTATFVAGRRSTGGRTPASTTFVASKSSSSQNKVNFGGLGLNSNIHDTVPSGSTAVVSPSINYYSGTGPGTRQ